MTPRVWVERPIESVEDAEALPVGSIALLWDSSRETAEVSVKSPHPDLDGAAWSDGADPAWWSDALMIGWTALVPVDATVEELPIGRRPGRRLCTAWEDL